MAGSATGLHPGSKTFNISPESRESSQGTGAAIDGVIMLGGNGVTRRCLTLRGALGDAQMLADPFKMRRSQQKHSPEGCAVMGHSSSRCAPPQDARHAPRRYLTPIRQVSDTARLLHCITVDILIAERGDYKWFDNIGECPSCRTWQLGDTVGRNDVFSRVRVVTEQHLVLRLSLW